MGFLRCLLLKTDLSTQPFQRAYASVRKLSFFQRGFKFGLHISRSSLIKEESIEQIVPVPEGVTNIRGTHALLRSCVKDKVILVTTKGFLRLPKPTEYLTKFVNDASGRPDPGC